MSNGYVDKARVLGTDYDIHVPNGTIDRAMLDTDLQEKIDDIAAKVNKPAIPGTSGQVLRNLGNGQTEWANVASPTDAQVETAVTDWLDAHPEATTTVEDFSLTANKLVKGTLGYVIPQQFGAKGDGVTDDSQAIKDCIEYAKENNFAVHLPAGTYIITHNGVSSFSIQDGQSVIVIGDGQNSVIKRKDNSVTEDWAQLFTFIISPELAHANDVILKDFCIDSNRRGQSEIVDPSSYGFEACADISLRNGNGLIDVSTQYLDRFIVQGMRFYDPIADCINISGVGNVNVRDVFIDNVVASNRAGTRSDIGITGNPLHSVIITRCEVGSMHYEYNDTVSDNDVIPYIISNCSFDACTLGGRFDLNMTGCVVRRVFLINSTRMANITNCLIWLKNSAYTLYSDSGIFDISDCQFITSLSSTTNKVYTFNVRGAKSVKINNCRFIYGGSENTYNVDVDGDGVLDHADGPVITAYVGVNAPIIVDNCEFDKALYAAISSHGNNITIQNMVMNTAYPFIVDDSDGGHTTIVNCENIILGEHCYSSIRCGGSGQSSIFKINGVVNVKPNNFKLHGANGTYVNNVFDKNSGNFKRVVTITSPLNYALIKEIAISPVSSYYQLFMGDTFEYDGANRQKVPSSWVIMDSSRTKMNNAGTAATEGIALQDRLISRGGGYGATSDRPTCYLSPGFEYFDTNLGKKIVWNGATWVNCDGTALS